MLNCIRFYLFFIAILCSFLINGINVLAQTKNDSIYCPALRKTIDWDFQKDIVDVLKKEPQLNHLLHHDTLKKEIGKGPFLSVIPGFGYTMVSGYTAAIVTNVSFYSNPQRDILSNFQASFYYSQNQQYWSVINSSIFDEKHKLHYLGDWRIYRFPTYTYGLGSESTLDNATLIDYSYLRFHQVVMRTISPHFYAGLGYHLDYYWNVTAFSENSPDLNNYGFDNSSTSSGISLNLLYDNRKNSVNPTNGFYANLQFRKNSTLLASNSDWSSLLVDIRKYIHIPNCSNSILAFWLYNNSILSGKSPYLDLPSIGWDAYSNTGRGYVPGRFRGEQFSYLEAEYRFRILNNGLLGGVVFTNLESFSEWPSDMYKHLMPGYGIGIRVKVNKFSNTNFAIDYGFGNDNPGGGFFFNLGEVF